MGMRVSSVDFNILFVVTSTTVSGQRCAIYQFLRTLLSRNWTASHIMALTSMSFYWDRLHANRENPSGFGSQFTSAIWLRRRNVIENKQVPNMEI
jgi:hypothetical protein